MADASQIVWNPDVQVGGTRRIAARGVTPNHYGCVVRAGGETGKLGEFEHFSHSTVLTLIVDEPENIRAIEVDLAHLDVIEIDA